MKSLKYVGLFLSASLAHQVVAESGALLEEIIVTAQRRSESIQNVPITINAFTQEEMKKAGIDYTYDLQLHTPGLVVSPTLASGSIFMRGVGTIQLSTGIEPAVAMHVDGVYNPRLASGLTDMYDVAQVEVIKGPQGILFGRNATGGAISINNTRPQNEFGGYVSLEAGNYDSVKVDGAINIPLVDDKVLFRLAALSHTNSGYAENPFLDRDEDDVDVQSFRAQLLFLPSDDLEIKVFGDYTEDQSGRGGASHVAEPLADNVAVTAFGGFVDSDVRKNWRDAPHLADIKQYTVGAEIKWNLGDMEFKSLTSYSDFYSHQNIDFDLTPLNVGGFQDSIDESESYMQEFQLASTGDGDIDWVVGAFYFDDNVVSDFAFPINGAVFGVPGAALPVVEGGLYDGGTSDFSDLDTTSWALFGQASYYLTEKWRVTLGLRYSYEEKEIDYRLYSLNIPTTGQTALEIISRRDDVGDILGAGITPPDHQKDDWNAFTPKFGIDYFWSEDVMGYLSISRGFKGGGYNTLLFGASPTLEAVDPEYIIAYELGLKSTLAEGRMRLNAALFYYDYSDLQLNILTADQEISKGFSNVRNVDGADIFGAELEIDYAISSSFTISAGLALLDTEITDLDSASQNIPSQTSQKGHPLVSSPEVTATLNAEYRWGLDAGELWLRGNASYRSEIQYDVFDDPDNRSDTNTVVNLTLGYEPGDGQWGAKLFARNVFDEEYEFFGYRTPFFGALSLYAPPRTYGAEVTYNF